MINEKDVVTLRMPFPNISSNLAVKAHMYICNKNENGKKKLLKAQTYKPNLEKVVSNYIKEYPDINRNPFKKFTLIDLDKRFCLNGIKIPIQLRTTNRHDVSQELYDDICNNIVSIHEEWIDSFDFLNCNENCYIRKIN